MQKSKSNTGFVVVKMSKIARMGFLMALIAGLSASQACVDVGNNNNNNNNNDGGLVILDGGLRDDAGEVETDSGTPAGNDGGVINDGGTPNDGGINDGGVIGNDAGEPPRDGGGFDPDGGFPDLDGGFPDLDGGGLAEYSGTSEEGVLCGAPLEACAVDSTCCVTLDFATFALTGACLAPDETCSGGGVALPFVCDGKEDCADDTVCCLASGLAPSTSCLAAEECVDPNGSVVCLDSSECPDGQICCGGSGLPVELPLDLGFCRTSCDLQAN